MSTNVACQAPSRAKAAIVRCESSGRAFCRRHTVILRRSVLAGSMGGSDRLLRTLGTSEPETVWLSEDCAAFTAPRPLDGARPV